MGEACKKSEPERRSGGEVESGRQQQAGRDPRESGPTRQREGKRPEDSREHSQRRTPVMLHRAIFGSLERFLGILIEHHAGRLPAWLAPVQAVVMNITDRQDAYVRQVVELLKNQGVRVECDLRNEKVGFKIREHTLQRVPYLLVAGDKEVAANLVSVRTRSGKDLGTMSPQAFVERLRIELESHGRRTLED